MRLIFLSLVILLSKSCFSCSCMPSGLIDEVEYNRYQLILKGNVIKVVDLQNQRVIQLKVATYYKGALKSDTAIIITPLSGGMCGIYTSVGEDWLFFAYADGYVYRSNLCTRSKNMNPKAWNYQEEEIKNDLEFLEERLRNPPLPVLSFIKLKIPGRTPVVGVTKEKEKEKE